MARLLAPGSPLGRWSPVWAVISAEKHADGSPHIHCVIKLSKKCNIRSASALDPLGGKHGDYKPAKGDLAKVVKYVIKDGDYVCHGFPAGLDAWLSGRKKKVGRMAEAALLIKSGKSLKEVDDMFPGLVMQHLPKMQRYEAWQAERRLADQKKDWVPVDTDLLSGGSLRIATWINQAIRVRDLQMGWKHLFLFGPSGVGKSSLVVWLSRFLRVYWMPIDGVFCDGYSDSDFDLVVLDEFKGQKALSWMNLWCGGTPMTFQKKGSQGFKRRNIPTIIISNYSLRDCYSGVSDDIFATIKRRVHCVSMSGPLEWVPHKQRK